MSKIEVNQISSQCGSTLTIGQSGDTVTLAAGATQSGFGRTGTVDWDTTAKTANFTAVSGNGYFVNTTSGAITVTLPAGSAGSIVSLKDYANTWDTNNVTVTPNGTDKINGENANATLSTQDQSVTLVYVDSTKGWRAVQDSTSDVTGGTFVVATGGTVTTCGNYKIHTFTGPGTFCVSGISNCSSKNIVSYIVVAGGGGASGGSGSAQSGAGAGGFREYKSPLDCYTASPLNGNPGGTAVTVTATSYPITVGAGGSGNSNAGGTPTSAGAGNNSVFSTVTSTGGGAGNPGGNPTDGNPGGSGGGGSANNPPAAAGSGNTPPVSPPQGNNGGDAVPALVSSNRAGGGGGGAGGAGGQGQNPLVAGAGGVGVSTSITGSSLSYAGGGGGSNQAPGGSGGGASPCGTGGVGRIAGATPTVGGSGTTNRGGGAGAGNTGSGGSGGSGIVVIRYKYQ